MPRFVICVNAALFGVSVHLEELPCYQPQRCLQLGGQGWGARTAAIHLLGAGWCCGQRRCCWLPAPGAG